MSTDAALKMRGQALRERRVVVFARSGVIRVKRVRSSLTAQRHVADFSR